MNFKILSDTFNQKRTNSPMIIRCYVSLINSLRHGQPSGYLRHREGGLTFVQALKVICIEDQQRQNSKPKSELKVKVNLVEDKSKRKFMNPKGKKFKKPNHFHSSPHANSSSFKPS